MYLSWASLVAQTVKRLPAIRETQVQFLGWEDPLEKEMAIHSSTLTRKIPVTCHGTWQVSCTESEAQDIQADSLLSRWEFQGMEGLQQSPNRLPVKVWGRNYLWMPATRNPGQLYTIPKEVKQIT